MLKNVRNLWLVGLLVFYCVGGLTAQTSDLAFAAGSSYSTINILLDGFDIENNLPISDIIWEVKGGRYTTRTDEKPFPLKTYVPYKPIILPASLHDDAEENLHILAIRSAFNVKGNNQIELIPIDQSKSGGKEGVYTYSRDGNGFNRGDVIPGIYIEDTIMRIGVYALGLLRRYHLEAEFETYHGIPFVVMLGDLNYRGWRILEADIPFGRYVKERDLYSNEYYLRLTKLVLRTGQKEIVDDFELYLDSLFYVRPMHSVREDVYDGIELTLPRVSDTFEWETSSP